VGVNALRRENLPQDSGTNAFTALGIAAPPLATADLGFPTLVVPGYETLGDDPNLPVVRRTRTIQVVDALTFDRGRHHVKTGGELRMYRSDGYNHLFARGQATFSGAFTPHSPPGVTCSATRSASPARCASAITGTRPACDTRFGSSNDACVRARLCNNRTYQVSSRARRQKRQILLSSQFRGHLSC
jgi:hypothetical protein